MASANAQSSTATLSGTVEDENGAVVPGASIAAINAGQGSQRLATTNNEGAFVFPLLPPGMYTVTAEREGFAPVEIKDVVLNVNDQAALRIQLKVGSIAGQTIDVVDGAPLIDESPSVGTVVDRQFIANLPLNGRSFQSLITLTPGVVLTTGSSRASGQFSVNGQRANSNYFSVDGVGANIGSAPGISPPGQAISGTLPGLTTFGGTNNLVSIDALQEFKIETSTYSAEFGRSPGGQVSLVTRSGTNEFHGSLFEYFRNEVLDANDWFANQSGRPKAPLRQNQFGGVIGGPVILPRFGEGGRQPGYDGRNRTFFFFSYEGLQLRTPQFALTNVPTLRLRQEAPAALRPILNAFPLPNGRDLGNGLAEFSAAFSNSSTLNATSLRIDHTLVDKLTIFGRYNKAPSRNNNRDDRSSLNNIVFTALDTQTLTFGATMVLTPRMSNEVRVNYSSNDGEFGSEQDNFGGAIPIAREILLPSQFAPAGTTASGTVFFNFPGRTASAPFVITSLSAASQRQVNIVDNFSFTACAHQLKFGVDYRRLSPIIGPLQYGLLLLFTSQANVLTGTAPFASINAQVSSKPIYQNFSAYAQDNWKLSRRLTLNLGLRWELNPPPSEANGNDPFTVSGLNNLATLTLAPQGTPLWKTTYNNFAPRLGFAYQLSQIPGRETVLRGGFGVFYDTGNSQGSAGFDGFPFRRLRSVPNVALPLSPAQVAPPPISLNPQFSDLFVFDPNLELPYTLQWNFAVEQSLGKSQTITASYVGSAGRRLLEQRLLDIRTINPTFTRLNLTTNDAISDYHSLQLQFQRRLSQGLQALASYTWSHAIDEASTDIISNLILRGNADFDVRHNFAAAVTYDIPAPKFNSVTDAVLGNWSIDTRINSQSAYPLNIVAGTIIDPINGTQIARRANLIFGAPLYLDDPNAPGGRRINRAAFSIPPTGQQGTLGRNVLRGFPAWQIDLALRRQFKLTERLNMQFRAEAFNLLNHPNFGTIQTDLTSLNFGQATNLLGRQLGGLNALYQVGGPRSLQFAIKLQF